MCIPAAEHFKKIHLLLLTGLLIAFMSLGVATGAFACNGGGGGGGHGGGGGAESGGGSDNAGANVRRRKKNFGRNKVRRKRVTKRRARIVTKKKRRVVRKKRTRVRKAKRVRKAWKSPVTVTTNTESRGERDPFAGMANSATGLTGLEGLTPEERSLFEGATAIGEADLLGAMPAVRAGMQPGETPTQPVKTPLSDYERSLFENERPGRKPDVDSGDPIGAVIDAEIAAKEKAAREKAAKNKAAVKAAVKAAINAAIEKAAREKAARDRAQAAREKAAKEKAEKKTSIFIKGPTFTFSPGTKPGGPNPAAKDGKTKEKTKEETSFVNTFLGALTTGVPTSTAVAIKQTGKELSRVKAPFFAGKGLTGIGYAINVYNVGVAVESYTMAENAEEYGDGIADTIGTAISIAGGMVGATLGTSAGVAITGTAAIASLPAGGTGAIVGVAITPALAIGGAATGSAISRAVYDATLGVGVKAVSRAYYNGIGSIKNFVSSWWNS